MNISTIDKYLYCWILAKAMTIIIKSVSPIMETASRGRPSRGGGAVAGGQASRGAILAFLARVPRPAPRPAQELLSLISLPPMWQMMAPELWSVDDYQANHLLPLSVGLMFHNYRMLLAKPLSCWFFGLNRNLIIVRQAVARGLLFRHYAVFSVAFLAQFIPSAGLCWKVSLADSLSFSIISFLLSFLFLFSSFFYSSLLFSSLIFSFSFLLSFLYSPLLTPFPSLLSTLWSVFHILYFQ